MKTSKKNNWRIPVVKTLKEEQLKKEIMVSACSKYFEACHPSNTFLDSIPGFKPEIM